MLCEIRTRFEMILEMKINLKRLFLDLGILMLAPDCFGFNGEDEWKKRQKFVNEMNNSRKCQKSIGFESCEFKINESFEMGFVKMRENPRSETSKMMTNIHLHRKGQKDIFTYTKPSSKRDYVFIQDSKRDVAAWFCVEDLVFVPDTGECGITK